MTEDWGCICCHFPIIDGMKYMTYKREGKTGYMCEDCFKEVEKNEKSKGFKIKKEN